MEDQDLQVAATAANGAEADLIRQRLKEAGIEAVGQRTIGGPEWGSSGSQYIYVDASDLDLARRLLSSSEGVSDAELERLAEDSGPAPPD